MKQKKKNQGKNTAKKRVLKVSNNDFKVAPLGSRVLIKPFTKEDLQKKNSFGIILPGVDSKEKSEQGVVVAVGPGEYREGKLVTVSVKVGDKVAFSKYGFDDITVDGEEFFLIKEDNILAILK